MKDDRLAEIARDANVARFASFGPGTPPPLRRLVMDVTVTSNDLDDVVEAMLRAAPSVNVRSFRSDESKSGEFVYGLEDTAKVADTVRRLAADGSYTIVNETVDVHDGGVSGVLVGDLVEFVPDDTPRGVEQPGAASMSRALGQSVLRVVYGVSPPTDQPPEVRTEFSVHPHRVGVRQERVLVWESTTVAPPRIHVQPAWPNRFSQHVGDKTFGLLVADAAGLPVPRCQVIPRRVAPFTFGRSTGTGEVWMRTAPRVQDPGRYTTTRGWTDPFALLAAVDAGGVIAAVIAQEAVPSQYAGAYRPSPIELVEGVTGAGDEFMLGTRPPDPLPDAIVRDVRRVFASARAELGAVTGEWAHDGTRVWVLQLHKEREADRGLLEGENVDTWLPFDPVEGVGALHELVGVARSRRAGINVIQPVGLTSHIGDILRAAQIPTRWAE